MVQSFQMGSLIGMWGVTGIDKMRNEYIKELYGVSNGVNEKIKCIKMVLLYGKDKW